MKRAVFGACCAVALTAFAVSAQDKSMAAPKMDKMDHMSMAKTYSGCLESSQAGSYSLTHPMAVDAMKPATKSNPMKKSDPAMKADSMKDDAMGKDAMATQPLSLSAPGKDLKKYVGQKVTVTGTDGESLNGMTTFTVKSVKMIGASCS